MPYSLIKTVFFLLISSFMSLAMAAESLREYHQRKCSEGEAKSCKRAEALLEGERHADRIVELGDMFAKQVDRKEYEEDNKPILKKSYLPILRNYFKAEANNGFKQTINNEALEMCADHFHEH